MDSVNWDRIADRLQSVMADLVHKENWSGPGFYAEALRRTFDYRPAEGSYKEYLGHGDGLTTQAYADHVRDGHVVIDRMNREKAEEQVKEMRAEMARVYRESATDLAAYLRARCNERTVPSRYRREGVTWAADMIDPSVPKDQYGRLPE